MTTEIRYGPQPDFKLHMMGVELQLLMSMESFGAIYRELSTMVLSTDGALHALLGSMQSMVDIMTGKAMPK